MYDSTQTLPASPVRQREPAWNAMHRTLRLYPETKREAHAWLLAKRVRLAREAAWYAENDARMSRAPDAALEGERVRTLAAYDAALAALAAVGGAEAAARDPHALHAAFDAVRWDASGRA